MENRGGTSTNGAGISITTTNIVPVNSNGSSEASTNTIDTGQTSGTITISYNFFNLTVMKWAAHRAGARSSQPVFTASPSLGTHGDEHGSQSRTFRNESALTYQLLVSLGAANAALTPTASSIGHRRCRRRRTFTLSKRL